MSEATIVIDYQPFPKQLAFHESTAKFRALITGVGFGKSVCGVNELLKMAVLHPNSTHVILAPNGKILQNATLPEFRKYARPLIARDLVSKNTIELINGAKIICLSADNNRHIERLRGITIGSYWADEAALFPSIVHHILIGRLRSKHGPLRGIYTTTPKGFNWLHALFVRKIDPKNKKPLMNAKDFEWFGGSSLDNPHTPQEYKDTLLAQYSGMFLQQEVYGAFTAFEGTVYPHFRMDVHIVKKIPEKDEIGWKVPMVF